MRVEDLFDVAQAVTSEHGDLRDGGVGKRETHDSRAAKIMKRQIANACLVTSLGP